MEFNEKTRRVNLLSEHQAVNNMELSFSDFLSRFKLTIQQQIGNHHSHTSTHTRDFNQSVSKDNLEEQLEKHLEFISIETFKDCKSAFLNVSQMGNRLADYRNTDKDAF